MLTEDYLLVGCRDDERFTPLFHATICGCPATMDTLLYHGADVNALEKNRVSGKKLV